MIRDILVSSDFRETRVAVVEDGELVELHYERPVAEQLAGNIYKGKVENVLPGMEAAFVNIGLERNAFLYAGDAVPVAEGRKKKRKNKKPGIRSLVKQGQEVLVQVTKEPLGTKGARITGYITLPGRYIVLMPTVDHIGISHKVRDEEERARLKELALKLRPKGMGMIIRTAARGCEAKDLKSDIKFLAKLWRSIKKRAKKAKAPELVYRERDLVYRIVRDMLSKDTRRFLIDARPEYEKARDLVSNISSDLNGRLYYYNNPEPLFEAYGLDRQINDAVQRKVWLKCGGYIIIDRTEALTVIDVNTGKYVGKTNLEDTALKTNLDAAREIARQLRLRDIGGIIVIDFIDMETDAHKDKVLETLEENLRRDRTKTAILGLTKLGLVELTRKKVRQGLDQVLFKECPYCSGRGRLLSEDAMGAVVEREVKRIARDTDGEAILLELHPSVAGVVIGAGGANLRRLERETGRLIYVRGSEDVHPEDTRVVFVGPKSEVEKNALPVRSGEQLDLKIEEPLMSNLKDGIGRVEGYVIDVEGAGDRIGQEVKVEITRAYRTYAKARMID